MSNTLKPLQDEQQPQSSERRTRPQQGAPGFAERRRFGAGFGPVDADQIGTDEAKQAYLAGLHERRADRRPN